MTYRAAVFDMDGLLLDSERPIRDYWLEAAREAGVPLTADDYVSVIGIPAREGQRRLQALFADPAMAGRLRARSDEMIAARTTPFDVKPGARALLERLREAGVPCGVASSTVHAEVERRLSAAGLRGFFRSIVGGDEVAHGKPAPDLYLHAAGQLGIDPARCLAFEDSNPGARAALAAGMGLVVVPDLKPPEADWQPRATAILASLEEALARVPGWFQAGDDRNP